MCKSRRLHCGTSGFLLYNYFGQVQQCTHFANVYVYVLDRGRTPKIFFVFFWYAANYDTNMEGTLRVQAPNSLGMKMRCL